MLIIHDLISGWSQEDEENRVGVQKVEDQRRGKEKRGKETRKEREE